MVNTLKEKIRKFSEGGVLLEMRVRGDYRSAELVVAYKGWIWLFDDGQPDEKIARHMRKVTGNNRSMALYNTRDIEEFFEDRHDVLVGRIKNDSLLIGRGRLSPIKHDPETSILVKKVVNELNLRDVEVYGSDAVSHRVSKVGLKGGVPDTAYHGTTSKHLISILKRGIRPGESPSNYIDQNISHDDKIFLTTHIDKAVYHATHASSKQGGFPVILDVEIPNESKLIPDFDVDEMAGKGSGYYERDVTYRDHVEEDDFESDPMSLSRELGVFGYSGVILPQKVRGVRVADNEDALSFEATRNDFKTLNREDALVWANMSDDYGKGIFNLGHKELETEKAWRKFRDKFGHPWVNFRHGRDEHFYIAGGELYLTEVEYNVEDFNLFGLNTKLNVDYCEFEDCYFYGWDSSVGVEFNLCHFINCQFEIDLPSDEIENSNLNDIEVFSSMRGGSLRECELFTSDGKSIEVTTEFD